MISYSSPAPPQGGNLYIRTMCPEEDSKDTRHIQSKGYSNTQGRQSIFSTPLPLSPAPSFKAVQNEALGWVQTVFLSPRVSFKKRPKLHVFGFLKICVEITNTNAGLGAMESRIVSRRATGTSQTCRPEGPDPLNGHEPGKKHLRKPVHWRV